MMRVYRDESGSFSTSTVQELPGEILWIDLLNPTASETRFVAEQTGADLPSRESLDGIDPSSRLFVKGEVIYLGTPVVAQADTAAASLTPVGFMLTKRLLVTIRFSELKAFTAVSDRITRDRTITSSAGVFTALLEAIIDRGAEVLGGLAADLDRISKAIFRGDPAQRKHTVRSSRALRRVLFRVGSTGDRLALARDVIMGISRIAPFVLSVRKDWIIPEFEARLQAVGKDTASLNDYEGHLSNKVQLLLDAVLGFINIQQNDLFKVLTIVSVVGIPPTIIVGIYGMNFKFMPELNWTWGYPFALVLIALSALVPLAWFKLKGWFE